MNIGMESQRIESEKANFFNFERRAQKYLDALYTSLGATIVDRSGNTEYDAIISISGKEMRIEEKIRDSSNSGIKDVAIEILQDIGDEKAERFMGWFYTERFDRLVYAWCKENTGELIKVFSIDWVMFKPWFLNWLCRTKHVGALVSCKGWGKTLNLLVPIAAIPHNVYKVLM